VHLEQAYIALKKGKNAVLTREYLQHLHLIEEWAVFKVGEEELEGKIIGLTEIGNLLLELPSGRQQSFGIKEISFPNF
jgi:BirA family transcriptional regulator, biotin operon repressor / biotin---[acetyl-CoA-carboxylase] ligase